MRRASRCRSRAPESTRCDPPIRWMASSKKTDDIGSERTPRMHARSVLPPALLGSLALAHSTTTTSSPSFCLLTRKMAKAPLLSSCSASPALSFILFWPPHSLCLPPSLQLHLMIRSRRRRPRPSTPCLLSQSLRPSLDTDPTLARVLIIKESHFGRTTMIAPSLSSSFLALISLSSFFLPVLTLPYPLPHYRQPGSEVKSRQA